MKLTKPKWNERVRYAMWIGDNLHWTEEAYNYIGESGRSGFYVLENPRNEYRTFITQHVILDEEYQGQVTRASQWRKDTSHWPYEPVA